MMKNMQPSNSPPSYREPKSGNSPACSFANISSLALPKTSNYFKQKPATLLPATPQLLLQLRLPLHLALLNRPHQIPLHPTPETSPEHQRKDFLYDCKPRTSRYATSTCKTKDQTNLLYHRRTLEPNHNPCPQETI